ncbi:hypothetical protein MTO96_010791 [Rhipicephalus appendiculatus]
MTALRRRNEYDFLPLIFVSFLTLLFFVSPPRPRAPLLSSHLCTTRPAERTGLLPPLLAKANAAIARTYTGGNHRQHSEPWARHYDLDRRGNHQLGCAAPSAEEATTLRESAVRRAAGRLAAPQE